MAGDEAVSQGSVMDLSWPIQGQRVENWVSAQATHTHTVTHPPRLRVWVRVREDLQCGGSKRSSVPVLHRGCMLGDGDEKEERGVAQLIRSITLVLFDPRELFFTHSLTHSLTHSCSHTLSVCLCLACLSAPSPLCLSVPCGLGGWQGDMELLMDAVFFESAAGLQLTRKENPVVWVESPLVARADREKVTRMLFDVMEVCVSGAKLKGAVGWGWVHGVCAWKCFPVACLSGWVLDCTGIVFPLRMAGRVEDGACRWEG